MNVLDFHMQRVMGSLIGPNAIVQDVFAQIPQYYDDFQVDVREAFWQRGQDRHGWILHRYLEGNRQSIQSQRNPCLDVQGWESGPFLQAADTAEIINK